MLITHSQHGQAQFEWLISAPRHLVFKHPLFKILISLVIPRLSFCEQFLFLFWPRHSSPSKKKSFLSNGTNYSVRACMILSHSLFTKERIKMVHASGQKTKSWRPKRRTRNNIFFREKKDKRLTSSQHNLYSSKSLRERKFFFIQCWTSYLVLLPPSQSGLMCKEKKVFMVSWFYQ